MSMQELFERKAKLANKIQELADSQDSWTESERNAWGEVNADFDSLGEEIAEAEEHDAIASRAAAVADELEQSQRSVNPAIQRNQTPGDSLMPPRAGNNGADLPPMRAVNNRFAQNIAAMNLWVRTTGPEGQDALTDGERDWAKRTGFRMNSDRFDLILPSKSLRHGHGCVSSRGGAGKVQSRDLGIATPTAGQETVPQGFLYELEVAMLAYGGLRNVARILRTATGNPMDVPTANDTGNVGELLAESTTIGTSVDPAFATIPLGAFKYSSKPILVAEELLEDSAFNMAAELGSMIGERIGRAQAVHFATGTGTGQPEGITNAPSDVTTAGVAIIGDELYELQHSVDPAYRTAPSVAWVMADSTLLAIRLLKDGQDNYLWQPSFQAGTPDMLLGSPVAIDQQMPAVGSAAVPIAYGDMSKYLIRDAAGIRLYRLNERYRDVDQTGFVAFQRSDGRLHDAGTGPIKTLTMLT